MYHHYGQHCSWAFFIIKPHRLLQPKQALGCSENRNTLFESLLALAKRRYYNQSTAESYFTSRRE